MGGATGYTWEDFIVDGSDLADAMEASGYPVQPGSVSYTTTHVDGAPLAGPATHTSTGWQTTVAPGPWQAGSPFETPFFFVADGAYAGGALLRAGSSQQAASAGVVQTGLISPALDGGLGAHVVFPNQAFDATFVDASRAVP